MHIDGLVFAESLRTHQRIVRQNARHLLVMSIPFDHAVVIGEEDVVQTRRVEFAGKAERSPADERRNRRKVLISAVDLPEEDRRCAVVLERRRRRCVAIVRVRVRRFRVLIEHALVVERAGRRFSEENSQQAITNKNLQKRRWVFSDRHSFGAS